MSLSSFTDLLSVPRATDTIRLGVPNQGRLLAQVRQTLAWPEWTAETRSLRFDRVGAQVALARSTDLPRLTAARHLDGCLTGHDYVVEAGVADELIEVCDLGLQSTTICVVGPAETIRESPRDRPLVVVSQYPSIAKEWLRASGRHASRLVKIDGAAELYVRSGIADVAVDAVMTGRSLAENGMCIIERLFESSGRVYVTRELAESSIRMAAMRSLVRYLQGDLS